MLLSEIRTRLEELSHLVERLAAERQSPPDMLEDLNARVRSREDVLS